MAASSLEITHDFLETLRGIISSAAVVIARLAIGYLANTSVAQTYAVPGSSPAASAHTEIVSDGLT